ncbi:Lysine histidine transporter-like 8 [Camellia lanceoleosa]|uniref:Lysine histidine transporter-like 8 n=1 Tax=Camellia lanceoleosa TaxID=1840588 RepID=A0ACC0IWT8_9ERIC|nr:Lysine histidine transporter-like 8 [Camellia lanceoleosa]
MSLTPRFISPLGSPIRRALHLTKLDPRDAWLPITESRNGNAYYPLSPLSAAGLGFKLLLSLAWGAICLTITFIWQLYTLWALVHLHESTETGMRYSRYLDLCCATFGDKLGNWLSLFPIMYLSGGTCVTLIIIGGSTANIFFQLACGATCSMKPLTAVEWYLVFTCAVVVLCQLPNLNSIAGVSLIGAITAVGYCTSMWVVSLGTMPSSEKYPSHVPMWKGVKVAYLLIALCVFPLAIAGYWAYGHLIPNGGMLSALFQFHSRDLSKPVLELICLFIIINALSSFQICGMPVIDHMESHYTSRMKKPCSWWIRSLIRAMFTFGSFFFAVAIPFLGSLAGLLGGIALPVTLAFPCFMWLKMKKPKKYSGMWWLNWGLGLLGVGLTVFIIAGGVYVVITTGIKVSFFKPAV